MPKASRGPIVHRLLESITFQFLCFVAVVVVYNRLIYALGSVSSHGDFSSWAAPLYALAMPIPAISIDVLARWGLPICVAALWMTIAFRWIGRSAEITIANDLAVKPAPAFGTQVRTALGFVLLVNLTTAMMDAGVKSITWPFSMTGKEYFGDAAHLRDPMQLLKDYPTMHLSHHAMTHPPGGVLFLWVVRKIAGEGLMTASLAAIVMTALTIIPAAMLARRFLSPAALSIFIGLYVLTPNLVLFGATSMDGVFAFFLICTAYFFFAATGADAPWRRTILRAVHVGLWLAVSTFFTYATVGLVTLFVVWWVIQSITQPARAMRIFSILAIAGATLVVCFALLYVVTGCNIIACARASMAFDARLMHNVRVHFWDVSVTNLLGFLVGSGMIAATLGIRCAGRGIADFWKSRRFAEAAPSGASTLCTALVVTLVLLSCSTLFTRELERVWFFFTPVLLIGASAELDRVTSPDDRRRWIVATMVLLFAQTWLSQLLLYTMW